MTKILAFTPGHKAPSSTPGPAMGAQAGDTQPSFLAIIAQHVGASSDRDDPHHPSDTATPFSHLTLFRQTPSANTDNAATAPAPAEAKARLAPSPAHSAVAFEAADNQANASPISAPAPQAPPMRSPAAQTPLRWPSSGARIDVELQATPASLRRAIASTQIHHRSTKAPALRARAQLNPIFVALHATDNEIAVYARAGRMAPTERDRLRNAVTALLAEYGIVGAPIRLDGQKGGDRWRK
jgi:hypothetical protein